MRLLVVVLPLCTCVVLALGCGQSAEQPPENPPPKSSQQAGTTKAKPQQQASKAQPVPASSITLYRGNAQRTGAYDLPAIRNLPTVKWQAKVGPSSLGSPVFWDGMLFVGAQDGRLHAFDGNSGKPRWAVKVDKFVFSSVAVADGKVYVGCDNLHVLDAATGKKVWSFPTPKPVWSAPLIDNGFLYFGSEDGMFYAIDIATKKPTWQRRVGERLVFGQAALANGTLYLGVDKALLAVDAATGKERWKTSGKSWRIPAVADGKVYAGADNAFHAVDAKTGKPLWTFQAQDDAWSQPAIAGSIVYAGNNDRHLYALDAHTGDEKWRFKGEDCMVSDPIVAGGVVYVGCGNHMLKEGPRHLYAIDAKTGKELWKFRAQTRLLTGPAIGDGALFAVTIGGQVYGLR